MKRFLFLLLALFGLNVMAQENNKKMTYEELQEKIRVQDSINEIEMMRPIREAFDKEKRKYLGKTFYLKEGSKLYKKGTPFKCVALDIDKWLNATISLVNKGDTLTMPADFSESSYRLSLTDKFKSLFSLGSGLSVSRKGVNYKLIAKTLYIGMSKKSVLYLMGNPKSEKTTITNGAKILFWEYPDNIYLTFLNGKLNVIQR